MAVVDTVTINTDTFSVYALSASNANSETDTFWNGRLGAERTAWEAASEDDQNRALVVAADWLDRASTYSGTKTLATQARQWPRDGASNTCIDSLITDGTVPDDIFYAQAWLAGVVLADNSASSSRGEGSNVRQAKAGSASVEFFRPTQGSFLDVRLPQVAHDFNRCYTQNNSSVAGPSITGITQVSSFGANDFKHNGGLS